nr:type II toxin-antitoxin system Phd/YefM family antitoxin [Kutzneria buriramensis]WKX06772.1 type II toxin-antitoxin system Phd/YefM family antitoxin [Kutzneria buriramensis]
MAHKSPLTQARSEPAELINRVVYGGEQVVLTRHGKPLVARVSARVVPCPQGPTVRRPKGAVCLAA